MPTIQSLSTLPTGDPLTDDQTFQYTASTINSINSIKLSDALCDFDMKQSAKNRFMSQLDPIKWPMLEDNTIIMVGIKEEEDETKTCRTSLGDLKRHLLNGILEELKRRQE